MGICPPFCVKGASQLATMLGSNDVALTLALLALATIAGVAMYRKLFPSPAN